MHLSPSRLFSILLVFTMTAVMACTAEVPGTGVGGEGQADIVRGQFNRDVEPLMNQVCAACHAGSMEFIDFMNPTADDPTVYDAVKAWPALVNVEDIGQSRLISKGAHDGRAWMPDELNLINPWLTAEAELAGGGEEIETIAVTPIAGMNEYDLGDLGVPEGAGSKIRFIYSFDGTLVYLSTLTVLGDADGVTITEPVVGIIAGGTTYWDPNNKFQGVTVDVAPNEEICVGSCSVIGSWVPQGAFDGGTVQLIFAFREVLPTGTGGAGGGGGCMNVDDFYNMVVPAIIANPSNGACTNCHGNGQVGINLSGLQAQDDAARQQQCNNVYIRSNRAVPNGDHDWIITVSGAVNHAGGAVGNPGNLDGPTDAWMALEQQ